jgi:hypothetical protein
MKEELSVVRGQLSVARRSHIARSNTTPTTDR